MGAFLRGLLKWTLAIVVLGGIVAYSVPAAIEAAQSSISVGDDEVPPEDATPSPSPGAASGPPVEDGSATAGADLTVIASTAGDPSDATLEIGPGEQDGVVLAFPLIPGDPACIASVSLEIQIDEATATQLFVYPSALFELDTVQAGPLSEDPILDSAPQAIAETDGSPGRLAWDLTQMYRTWANAEPFPTGGVAPAGTPFTLVVKPEAAEAEREVVLLSGDAAAGGPTLSWTGEEECGSADAPASENAVVDPPSEV